MSNVYKDQLFTLIKSLNKAEKRNFKLYATRHQSSSDVKFIQLFDVLDRLEQYDEEIILSKLPGTKKRHLGNLKRHLYRQVLTSLRLIHIDKNIDIQIREQLDFARILYGKGMYMQSLRILERIKRIAEEHHQDILHLEILEFQKLIEARHITRSRTIENKMDSLLHESNHRSSVALTSNQLSNLTIQIQGKYIENGHIQNKEEGEAIEAYFIKYVPKESLSIQLTFFEKANLYQAHFWRNYILLDFPSCVRFARQWYNLFVIDSQMREKDPDLFMRANYYLLTAHFLTHNEASFSHYLKEFEAFWDFHKKDLNPNSEMIGFTYLHLSRLNQLLLQHRYEEGLKHEKNLVDQLSQYEAYMDMHRILLFYYKFACFHFCCGQFEQAIDHLNNIINNKNSQLREDLFLNARILQLICHYELQQYDLMDYLILSVRRAVLKSAEHSKLQLVLLQGLKVLANSPPTDAPKIFGNLLEGLEKEALNPFEKKNVIYLNPVLWIKSHLHNCYVFQLSGINTKTII